MAIKSVNKGAMIAKLLFPELELVIEGDFWDQYGIDARIGKETIQIKYDSRIASSQNIWHEIYEKTAWNEEQAWRKSPGNANTYIFTTETNVVFWGYKIPIYILAETELNKKMIAISPNNGKLTSMGFLIPIRLIPKGAIIVKCVLKAVADKVADKMNGE